jgi:hypothetical protein
MDAAVFQENEKTVLRRGGIRTYMKKETKTDCPIDQMQTVLSIDSIDDPNYNSANIIFILCLCKVIVMNMINVSLLKFHFYAPNYKCSPIKRQDCTTIFKPIIFNAANGGRTIFSKQSVSAL